MIDVPDAVTAGLGPLTADPRHAGVLCDVDGTLAPIVERPEQARVSSDVARLLTELARRYACVACVSGRRAVEARRLVGVDSIAYAGLHGAEVLTPGEARARVVPAVEGWAGRVRQFSDKHDTVSLRALKIRIEDKGPIVAFHWRGAPDEDAASASLRRVAQDATSEGLATHWGRKVLEVRPPVPIDKGLAVRHLVEANHLRVALYAGDDATDLDAFDALDALVEHGVLDRAVRVGVRSDEGPHDIVTRADLVVDSVGELVRVLEVLANPAGVEPPGGG